jgi:glutamine synthetase
MCGVPRGKRLRQHEVKAVYKSGRFLPGSVLVVDITGRDCEETGLVWEDGDADRYVYPVPGTLVRVPWLGENYAQFLTSFYELDGTPNDLDPRHVLGRVIDGLAEEGLTPVVAVELEFYLCDLEDGKPVPARGMVTGHRSSDIQVYGLREMEDLQPFFDDLYTACDVQDLPLESGISEYAPGQFEFTLRHKADALRATDDAIMYKRLVKGVAVAHGLEATFMAKPFAETAGSGMHLHISMNDKQGKNAFASEDPAGTPLLRHAIGGMKSMLAESMAIFAPNANSFRRFKANSYAHRQLAHSGRLTRLTPRRTPHLRGRCQSLSGDGRSARGAAAWDQAPDRSRPGGGRQRLRSRRRRHPPAQPLGRGDRGV